MKNFDSELYDFIRTGMDKNALFESSKKAFGTPIKSVLNEDKAKGDIKPADQTDKPKETAVEKELKKETKVDIKDQKEDSSKQKETKEKKEKEVGEGKVPANPATIDDPEKTVQELKEELGAPVAPGTKKVVASGISDETVAKRMAMENKGTAVQDPETKTWSVEVVQESKKECECGKGKTCACKNSKYELEKKIEKKEEKVEEKAAKCPKCGKKIAETPVGGDPSKYCQGHGIGEKKSVKESKDDFTWGFAKSVLKALKNQNFTPKIDKLCDFLEKLEPEKLDAIKLAVMDNDAGIFTQLINSIATGAPFEIAPTAPVNPEPNPADANTNPEALMNKDQLNQNANMQPAMAESKKVNEGGIPIAMDGEKTPPIENEKEIPGTDEDEDIEASPADNQDKIVTSPEGEGIDIEGIEITPELAQELIAMTDLNPEADLAEFTKGLEVEKEHFESVEENKEILAKIVADHIKEFPGVSYYDALSKMEAELIAPETEEIDNDKHEEIETPEEENIEHDVESDEEVVKKTEESKK